MRQAEDVYADTGDLELERFAGGIRGYLPGLQRLIDQPHDAVHGSRP